MNHCPERTSPPGLAAQCAGVGRTGGCGIKRSTGVGCGILPFGGTDGRLESMGLKALGNIAARAAAREGEMPKFYFSPQNVHLAWKTQYCVITLGNASWLPNIVLQTRHTKTQMILSHGLFC